jgi:hypothetical protein
MQEAFRCFTTSRSGGVLMLLCALLVFAGSADTINAQTQVHDNSIKNYKMPRNWKKYFEEKYINLETITSTVQETPHGPLGHLHIGGHFKIKNFEAVSGDRIERGRAMAQAFLRDEKEVLGFRDLYELREYKIWTSQGHDGEFADIVYARYIGDLPIDGSSVHISIGPDETIWFMDASLVPSPVELYEAAAKRLITDKEAIQIVEQDMQAMAIDPKEKKISKTSIFATAKPPYIFWIINTGSQAHGWSYTLDALTGDRISKKKRFVIPSE